MGIGPREPKCLTFCARHLFQAPADSIHKNIHRGAHGCLWVLGLK